MINLCTAFFFVFSSGYEGKFDANANRTETINRLVNQQKINQQLF